MLALANKLSLNTQPIYRFVNKYSIDFDGVDDRIITDGADTVAQPTTYSFWAKTSHYQQNFVFGHGDNNYGSFVLNHSSGMPLLWLNSQYYRYWTNIPQQDDGEWHHWVVYSDTNDITNSKLYCDGVLQTVTSTVATNGTLAYTDSLIIGATKISGGSNYFEGKIDEFAVYDRELTQDEITRMYNTYYSPNRVANGNFSQIGSEQIPNTDFSDNSEWQISNTSGTTGWTISNGQAIQSTLGASNGRNLQPSTSTGSLVSGKVYKVVIDFAQATENGMRIGELGGAFADFEIIPIGTIGVYTYYRVATFSGRLNIHGGTDTQQVINNISVKEVGQHWTFGTGWSMGDGKVVTDGTMTSSDTLLQTFDFVDGATYKFTFTILDYVSGGVYIREPYNGYLDVVSANGTYSFNYVAGSSNNIQFRSDNNFTGSIDNIVVQELKHDATNLMLNHSEYQSANPLITSTKSMEFDGTDDYLQLSEPFSHTNHTITGWFKLDVISGITTIFDARDSADDGLIAYIDGTGRLSYRVGDGTQSTIHSSSLDANKWYNFACTYDGTTQTIYINGVDAVNTTVTKTISTTTNATIGKVSYTNALYYDGQITEVGAYNRCLTALEVASLYNQGMPTNLLVNRNNYQSGNPTVFNTKQVDFDGTDDKLVFNTPSAFSGLGLNSFDCTLSAWAKFDTIGVFEALVSLGTYDLEIAPLNATDVGIWVDNAGLSTTYTPTMGEWNHYVATKSGNTYSLYVDGVLIGSDTDSDNATIGTQSFIGNNGASNYFDGDISQVGMWNEALTADEVSSLYNHGLPIDLTTDQAAYKSSSNLVGYWRMGSGTLDNYFSIGSNTYGVIADQTNATLGNELITNGNFDTDSNWLKGAGWTISGGKANRDGSGGVNSSIYQYIPVVNGKVYKYSYTRTYVSGTGQTNIYVRTNGVDYETLGIYNSTVVEEKTITGVFTAGFTGNMYWKVYGIDTFTGSIDNVSVKEFGGNPAIMTNQTSSDIENGSPYANLVQNGTFDTDSDWTKGTGVTISGGKANWTNTANNVGVNQNGIITSGKTYKISYTVSNYSSGSIRVRYPFISDTITANGTYTATAEATSTDLFMQGETSGDANVNLSIDNVTVEEVNTGLQGYWKMGDGTNDEYPVIYDQTNPDLGSEIIANGDFTTDSGWTIGTGWSISGGKANATDAVFNSQLTDSTTLVAGKVYKISFDVSNYVKGNVNVTVGNVTSSTVSSEGSYTFYLTTSLTTPFRFSTYAGGSGTTLSVDNVSVKEVQGNPATMTNMVEGNITNQFPLTKIRNYYRMGDGILDGYPIIQDQTSPNLAHIPTTNLIPFSEDFTDSSWSNQNTTINSSSITSPDGTNSASEILETTNNGNHGRFYTLSSALITPNDYSVSMFVKKLNRRYFGLQSFYNSTNGAIAFFDLDTGTLLYEFAEGTDYSVRNSKIENFGNGWYKISTIFQVPISTLYAGFVLADTEWTTGTSYDNYYAGDVTKGAYIWGFQLEEQSQATAYIKSDGIAAVRKSSTTNEFLYSEDFTSWNGYQATSNITTAPDGSTVTFLDFEDVRMFPTTTVTNSTLYTSSVYLKANKSAQVKIRNVAAQDTTVTLTTDWVRYEFTATTIATTSNSPLVDARFSQGVGVAGLEIAVWGVQLEQQTQAETYAKTTGLPVTIDLFTENNYGTMTNMSASDIVEDTP